MSKSNHPTYLLGGIDHDKENARRDVYYGALKANILRHTLTDN